jgi:hypothetical protein
MGQARRRAVRHKKDKWFFLSLFKSFWKIFPCSQKSRISPSAWGKESSSVPDSLSLFIVTGKHGTHGKIKEFLNKN